MVRTTYDFKTYMREIVKWVERYYTEPQKWEIDFDVGSVKSAESEVFPLKPP